MFNRYELAMRAVELYEARKVASMFAPLANATLEKIGIANGDRVLDVACGTGIVARTIRDQCGPDVRISGLDINDMMLAKAQVLSCDLPGQIDWYVSDVTDIPTVSNAFSHVFCQQGLQYFPDDLAALTEMHRVLSIEGKLVLTVWGPANEYFLAQSAAMKKYVSAEAGEKALAPFSYPATIRVPELLARLGFKDVTVGTVSIERVIRDAETGVREDILGSPLGSMVENIEPSVMEGVVRDILSECTEYLQNGDLIIAQKSALITASAC
jgi:SAM-dependent methyltransferase